MKTEEVDSALRGSRETVIVSEQGKNRMKVLFQKMSLLVLCMMVGIEEAGGKELGSEVSYSLGQVFGA